MKHSHDLFGKTFDKQLELIKGEFSDADILPNRRIPGEIILEPFGAGVRVTARDSRHRILWGFIGSKGMIEQTHCPVAIYDTLQDMISTELVKNSLPGLEEEDPIKSAKQSLAALISAVKDLEKSVTVKKISPATRERATTVARLARDARRVILLSQANEA